MMSKTQHMDSSLPKTEWTESNPLRQMIEFFAVEIIVNALLQTDLHIKIRKTESHRLRACALVESQSVSVTA